MLRQPSTTAPTNHAASSSSTHQESNSLDVLYTGDSFEEFYTQALQKSVIEVSTSEIDLSLLTQKKKKRKAYYIPVNFAPRVLKNDIRRDYAKMLVNSFNSADDKMVHNFFHEFAHPHCQLIRYSAKPISENNPVVKYVEGLETIIPQLVHSIKVYPDIAVSLLSSTVIPSFVKEEGSKIFFQANVKLTKIFHTVTPHEHPSTLEAHQKLLHYYGRPTIVQDENMSKVWVVPNSNVTSLNVQNRAEMIEDVTTNVLHQKLIMEPCLICQSEQQSQLQAPKEMFLTCHVAMCLDTQYRIHRLEIFSVKLSKPKASLQANNE